MFFQNSRVLLGFPVLGRKLMSRTLGFFLSLQPKQLLSISIVLHSKVSQTSNSGGKVLVYKKVPGLDLYSSHLIPTFGNLQYLHLSSLFLSNLSCLKLENYQVGRVVWRDLFMKGNLISFNISFATE